MSTKPDFMDQRIWTDAHWNSLQNILVSKFNFPLEIIEIIQIFVNKMPIIIDNLAIFFSNIIHVFDTLTITKNGIVTVDSWNPIRNKNGGILRIHCDSLILEEGGIITVSEKGYLGGEKGGYQGYSFINKNPYIKPKISMYKNEGGGGGTLSSIFGAGGLLLFFNLILYTYLTVIIFIFD